MVVVVQGAPLFVTFTGASVFHTYIQICSTTHSLQVDCDSTGCYTLLILAFNSKSATMCLVCLSAVYCRAETVLLS